jgi:glucose-1-phosphate thymidylyltransferase
MAPVTKVTNKHLLPVYTMNGAVPMIHFPIRTLVSSGIEDILIISSRQHSGQIIEHLGDGSDFGADFSYKVQDLDRVQLGIASALKLAKNFTRDERFAVILGDNFFEETFEEEFRFFNNHAHPRSASVFITQVDDPHRFGVPDFIDATNNTRGIESSSVRIKWVYEKPKQPSSDFAVTGLYLYTKFVYELADKLTPSARGELEITDITNHFASNIRLTHYELGEYWSDMGTPESMRRTQEYLRAPAYG